MDLLKPEEWHRQWSLVQSAPFIMAPLLAIAIGATWWLKGQFADQEITGLKQQLAVRDDRLKLADERAQIQRDARQEVERQFAELRAKPESGASLEARLQRVETALAQYQAASKALEGSVIRADLRAAEPADSAQMSGRVQ